jgi:peptidoglycan-N-acetylglucosamine deacetylase
MRYQWPDGKRCAVVLSFDFDAESGFIFREPELAKRSLGGLEERRFGPRVGVDRILRMLDRLRLPATFYIPGWTVENHPAQSKRIRDAGHEIGAHGNVHEAVGFLDRPREEEVMRQQLAILQDQLGVRPAGYRSPSWDVNVWTPGILKSHGFLYDTSLMGDDVPYEVDTEHGPLVEVPVQWLLDDAPLFRHVYGAGNVIADPARVFDLWSREFAGMHREGACFVLTCHPFVIGRASRIMLLEELVAYMRRFRGVWFTTGEAVARWHAERRSPAGTRPERGRRPRRGR